MKYLLVLAGIFGLVFLLVIPRYLGPDDLVSCSTPQPLGACRVADAIVAVSGGDTEARTDEAIRLYKAGWAPKLVFSGAAADKNSPSNALIMQKRAIQQKVPRDAITIEEFSRTTSENALNTSKFITDGGIKRIILVTSTYHQRRAFLEFSTYLGPSVTVLNHPVRVDHQWIGTFWFMTPSGWWLVIGELIKIAVFYSGQGVGSL
jgi:uncharacterized SAM-binding protein YcdF (DUF218 family)